MADGTLKVGTITTSSGSGTITLGQSGETVDMANGSITLNSSMKNTPAFEAYLGQSTQPVSDNTITKIEIDTEVYDTDSDYDHTTNYRFTPTTSGKYFVYGSVDLAEGDAKGQIYLYKNGSSYKSLVSVLPTSEKCPITFQAVVDMNGSSDYLELFGRINTTTSGQLFNGGSDKKTYFGAYKLIGA